MATNIPRVGEGHYTGMPKMSIEHWQMVQHVLREMRQITSKLVINGGKYSDSGHMGQAQAGERGSLPMDISGL